MHKAWLQDACMIMPFGGRRLNNFVVIIFANASEFHEIHENIDPQICKHHTVL